MGVWTSMRRLLAIFALTIGLSGALGACDLLPGPSEAARAAILRVVAEHQAIWAAKQVDSYSFTIERSCFCPESVPIDITVVDGVPAAITSTAGPVDPTQLAGLPRTIDEAFELAAASAGAARLDVEWDPALGYPTRIDVDPIANALDDEFTITITNLRQAS